MGHAEAPVGLFRADFIQLTSKTSETTYPAGTAGRLKISGVKLYVDNGSAWSLVTSA